MQLYLVFAFSLFLLVIQLRGVNLHDDRFRASL